jgi:hypothetical protein
VKARLPFYILSFAISAAFPIAGQSQPAHPEIVAKLMQMPRDREEPVKWETQCDEQACTLSADVLRGASNDPPDRTDHDQYISILVALDRKTAKPLSLTFHIPPWARKNEGVFLAFAQPSKDGEALKYEIDADGARRLALTACDDESCVTKVAGGRLEASAESHAAENHDMDWLEKLLASDHLLILYMSDDSDAPYKTAISLATFKKEYQRVLKGELAQAGGH